MSSDLSRRAFRRVAARIVLVLPLFLFLLGLVPASNCADLSRGGRSVDAGGVSGDAMPPSQDGADDQVSFERDVHGLLVDGCGGCHVANGSAGGSAFTLTGDGPADLPAVIPFISVDQPSASRLLSKGAGVGHAGGAVYRPETMEYQIILRWITGGAPP